MPKSTNYDFIVFFYCILAGVILCILADLFRALRINIKLGVVAVFIYDTLFFVIAGFVTFFMQYIYSNGQLRWYIMLGEICGFLCAKTTISKVDNIVFSGIYKILHKFLSPVFNFFHSLVSTICKFLLKKIKKSGQIIKKFLKSGSSLLYNKYNSDKKICKNRKVIVKNGKKKKSQQK